MNKIAITLFLLAVTVILYLTVFAPISNKTKNTGSSVITKQDSVDSHLGTLAGTLATTSP
jgi:hypothetical protein